MNSLLRRGCQFLATTNLRRNRSFPLISSSYAFSLLNRKSYFVFSDGKQTPFSIFL